MIKNNFILPVCSSESDWCLTSENIYDTGVSAIACNLSSMLIRPGIESLYNIKNFKKYMSWNKTLVINASLDKLNSNNEYVLISKYNGRKYAFSQIEILDLLLTLSPDVLLFPKDLSFMINDEQLANFKLTKCFFDLEARKESYGVYLEINTKDNLAEIINYSPELPKYLYGDISLDDMRRLLDYNNIYFASSKPCTDGYNGLVYSNGGYIDITEENNRFNFALIDGNCKCFTCREDLTIAYLHHLFKNTPLLCQRLLISHNVFYISHLPEMEITI